MERGKGAKLIMSYYNIPAWNTLPDNLRDPALLPHTFRAGWKTLLFSSY